MNNCGFTAAALPSITTHIRSTNVSHKGYYTNEQINSFFLDNIFRFLTSIGFVFARNDERMDSKVIDRYVKHLIKMKNEKYLKNCEISIDSAGYQIQQGFLSNSQITEFNKLYHEYFLCNNSHLFDKAFTLDIIPGLDYCPYTSWKELEDFNCESFSSAIKLKPEILDKMIYIHHFRTPNMYKLYRKLFYDYEFSKHFNKFATGGLVRFSSKEPPPCIMYVVPITDVLSMAKQQNKKDVTFHVLGETEWKSILAHCFIERHVKTVHDINLKITFDSSTIFKIIAMARYTYTIDNDCIYKVSMRSDKLDNIWRETDTYEDTVYKCMNDTVRNYGMRELQKNIDPIYNKDDSMNKIFYTYGMLQIFKLFKDVQDMCYKIVDDIYPIY